MLLYLSVSPMIVSRSSPSEHICHSIWSLSSLSSAKDSIQSMSISTHFSWTRRDAKSILITRIYGLCICLFSLKSNPMSMKSGSTRTLDSKVWRKRFITPIQTNIPPSMGLFITSIQNTENMIVRNSTPPKVPHSTNCWIYQLSGI